MLAMLDAHTWRLIRYAKWLETQIDTWFDELLQHGCAQ